MCTILLQTESYPEEEASDRSSGSEPSAEGTLGGSMGAPVTEGTRAGWEVDRVMTLRTDPQ